MNSSIISTALISIFFLFIVIGFVAGWVRGLNKSLTRFIMVLIMAVLAFFVVPPITKAILQLDISKFNISIGGTAVITVEDAVMDLLAKIPFVSDIVDSSPTFAGFISAVPQMLVNVVLFVVFFFLLKWFSMIFYWIIAGVCFNKKKMAGKEKHNFIGAVIGALQGLLVVLIIFVPCFGVLDTVKPVINATKVENVQTVTSNTETAEEGNDKITEAISQVEVYVDAADNNWVFKMLGAVGIRKLSDAMFDGLTTVKVDDVKYGLRREVNTLAEAYPAFKTATNGGFNIRDNETLEALKTLINKLFESPVLSGMVDEVVPAVAERWLDPQNLDFCGVKRPNFDNGGSVDKMFDALLRNLAITDGETIKHDLITGVELIQVCNDAGLLDAVAGDKGIMDVLEGERGEHFIIDVINKALESKVLKAVLPDVVKIGLDYVYDALEIKPETTIGQIQDHEWDDEKPRLQRIFTNVFKIYDQINKSTEESPVYSLDFELLGSTFDDMRESKLLGPSSKNIMMSILDSNVLIGDNKEIMTKFKDSLSSAWDKPDVSFAKTFKSLGDALKLAKDMNNSTSGELNFDNLKDVVKQLNEANADGVLGDVINDVLDENMLKDLGVSEDVAGVVSDVIGSIIDKDYSDTEGGIEAEIEAAEQIFDVANKVLSSGDEGNVELENTDELVDALANSSVLLEELTSGDKVNTSDLLTDSEGNSKFSEDTQAALEESIKKQDPQLQDKLRELLGLKKA